jgi:hypothetical protein
MVATKQGLEWRSLAELQVGDYVAQQYGNDLWSSLPARFDYISPSIRYGNQKPVRIPSEMTEELAFLLGAFAAEGHLSRRTHTVVITNSVESVLERVASAWRSEFGVATRITREPGKCPGVVVSSTTLAAVAARARSAFPTRFFARLAQWYLPSCRASLLTHMSPPARWPNGRSAWMRRSYSMTCRQS